MHSIPEISYSSFFEQQAFHLENKKIEILIRSIFSNFDVVFLIKSFEKQNYKKGFSLITYKNKKFSHETLPYFDEKKKDFFQSYQSIFASSNFIRKFDFNAVIKNTFVTNLIENIDLERIREVLEGIMKPKYFENKETAVQFLIHQSPDQKIYLSALRWITGKKMTFSQKEIDLNTDCFLSYLKIERKVVPLANIVNKEEVAKLFQPSPCLDSSPVIQEDPPYSPNAKKQKLNESDVEISSLLKKNIFNISIEDLTDFLENTTLGTWAISCNLQRGCYTLIIKQDDKNYELFKLDKLDWYFEQKIFAIYGEENLLIKS